MEIIQYQIVLVNLDPGMGSEIYKTRPCVIISPKEMNKYLQTVIVAPMTTNMVSYPTRIKIKLDKKAGSIVIDQIRTIDKKRIIKILGQLNNSEIKKVKSIIHETFVD